MNPLLEIFFSGVDLAICWSKSSSSLPNCGCSSNNPLSFGRLLCLDKVYCIEKS